MAKYDIIGWANKRTSSENSLFGGKARIEVFTGLSYGEARKYFLDLYNNYMGKKRGRVKTLYKAYGRDESLDEGMYISLRAFDYEGYTFEIVEAGEPSWRCNLQP